MTKAKMRRHNQNKAQKRHIVLAGEPAQQIFQLSSRNLF